MTTPAGASQHLGASPAYALIPALPTVGDTAHGGTTSRLAAPCQVCGTAVPQAETGRPRMYCGTRCAEQAKAARAAARAAADTPGALDTQLAEAHRLADRLSALGLAVGQTLATELSPAGVDARIAAVRAEAAAAVAHAEQGAASAQQAAEHQQAAADAAAEVARQAERTAEQATADRDDALLAASAAERAQQAAEADSARHVADALDARQELRAAHEHILELESTADAERQRHAQALDSLSQQLHEQRLRAEQAQSRVEQAASRTAVAEDRLGRVEADLAAEKTAHADARGAVTAAERQAAILATQLQQARDGLDAERRRRESAEQREAAVAAKAVQDLNAAVAREASAHEREIAALRKALELAEARTAAPQ